MNFNGALLNDPCGDIGLFNGVECLLEGRRWELYLEPETKNTLVSFGDDDQLPAGTLLAGHCYRLRILDPTTANIVAEIDFCSPHPPTYDELGG